MAKDVRFLISANVDRAEKEIRKLQATGGTVSDSLSRSFDALGIKSSASFDKKRQAAQTAYDRIKSSGQATNDELARSQQALGAKLTSIDEEQFGKRTGLLEKFKANWIGVTAAIGAAWVAVSQGWDMANEAAKGIQQRQSFANLAASHGESAQAIIEGLKSVSGQTVSTAVLVEKAGTALILGIPADKLSGLMEVAVASSKVTGQSVTEAFGDISLAVARSSRLILDNLGIIVSEEAAYKTYAAQIGKTAAQLSDAEKKTAFMNATLAAGKDIIDRVGSSGESMAQKMQRVTATMANMKETIGRGVLGVLLILDGAMNGVAATALLLSYALFKALQGSSALVGNRAKFEEYRLLAKAALDASLDLGNKGGKSLGDAMDVISGKMGEANSKMGAMQNQAALAAEATEKLSAAKKDATETISAYSKEVEKLGALQLKAAASGFADDLKRQGDYLKINNSLAANLSAPIQQYLAVINDAYGKQLDLQKQIGQALFKTGADQRTIAQQNITIVQTEKTAAEARLGAWTQYYDSLRAMHSSAMTDMTKSQTELMNIRSVTGDLVAQIQQKMMTPMQQYYAQVAQLEEKQKQAQQLSGDEKIKMLQQVQQSWSGLSNEIKDGDKVLLGQAEAAAVAINKITSLGTQLEAEKAAQIAKQQETIATLESTMATAKNMITEYQAKIVELDGTVNALTRTFSLTMKDEASGTIAAVKSELDKLRDKTITVTVRYQSEGGGGGATAPSGSFASGTDYIPATGLYLLHKGEEVKNTARVNAENKTTNNSAAYNFSGNIVLPNVTNQTSARELFTEFQKLARRQAA